ncbi:MAG: RNA polymerase factor sigma-54 [Gemmatimonadales bacterium]
MKTSLQQTTSLKQELRMNPRLYQAMDLLYMPLLDLQQHLKQELEVNPFLEFSESEELEQEVADEREPEAEKAEEDETDWENILLDGFSVGGRRAEFEDRELHQPVAVEMPDLADHLWEQLFMLVLSRRQLFLAEEFVGNIGEDGYLQASLEDIQRGANERRIDEAGEQPEGELAQPFTAEECEELLDIIQKLDPPGIAARDLRECLLIQLASAGERHSLTYWLVDEAFEDLINHRWGDLARRYGVDPKEVQAAADELSKLDPKPGLRFLSTEQEYVIPDLVVEKVDGDYRVYLNDAGTPRLRISKIYREIAGDKKKFVGENREFITDKLNSAQWLIQAIEQRRQTMLRVMHFIVDRQRDFFERGVEHLKPLTLREVAEVVNMHESTISRVTSQKYVQTPRGVYPLRFFFSSGLGTTRGEDASSRAVKALMRKLVQEEDPAAPLTDAAIVKALEEQGIRIARRTVAKYRDQLGILPARMRRRV